MGIVKKVAVVKAVTPGPGKKRSPIAKVAVVRAVTPGPGKPGRRR